MNLVVGCSLKGQDLWDGMGQNHYFKERYIYLMFKTCFYVWYVTVLTKNILFVPLLLEFSWDIKVYCICEKSQETTNTPMNFMNGNKCNALRTTLFADKKWSVTQSIEWWPLVFLQYISLWFPSGCEHGVKQLHTITDNYRPWCCLTAEFSTKCLQVKGCFRAPWTFKCTQMREEPSSGA